MTVMALVFSVVLDVWHVSAVNQKHLLTKSMSFTGTTTVLNAIAKEVRIAAQSDRSPKPQCSGQRQNSLGNPRSLLVLEQ